MKQVIHLMPYDGIGGVELAAKSGATHHDPDIALALHYIFPNVSSRAQRGATFNPFAFFTAAWRIYQAQPDLLIVSLWRASIVGLIVKCLRPRTRLVTFIHNSKDAHLADRLLTRLSIYVSEALFFDSESSLKERFTTLPKKHTAIISFLTRHLEPAAGALEGPSARFIFWGRLNKQKNLPRALELFSKIHAQMPDAHFDLIGPDGGELPDLMAACRTLALESAVTFHGPLQWDEIAERAVNASFYLQTSQYEGMAMAVTEAMQLGLVPIVTPVGEIATYCTDENAVILGTQPEDQDHIGTISDMIINPSVYDSRRQAAIDHWAGKRVYCEDLFDQLHHLLFIGDKSARTQSSET